MMKSVGILGAVAAFLLATPATADVVSSTPTTMEIHEALTIDAPIQQVWDTLRSPQRWWSKDHTYSDDSANLYMDTQATGCFCERFPDRKGSVEHARILYIQPPRMIRLSGALGPLQAEAVIGTLTFKLDQEGSNATKLTIDYVVSGYVRAGADTLAPKVDEVLALQAVNLKFAAEGPQPQSDKPTPTR
jgi:uncharacterized protein YndB with AHSA1/START domain